MAMKVFSIRLDDGLVARIDALGQKRAVFIRDALEAALADEAISEMRGRRNPSVGRSAKDDPAVPPLKTTRDNRYGRSPSPRKSDARALLLALQKKPMSFRDAEQAMGWLGLRYANAERKLLDSGAVRVEKGILTPTGASADF